jgi:hypothetical protein
MFDRPVTNGDIAGPCTFAGSFKRQLAQWSHAGCKVSDLLQDPNNHQNGEIDYIAARAGMLSYLPKGKPHTANPDGTWSRQGRQEGKPGRVVQKILTPETRSQVTDKDLATFGDNTRGAGLLDSGIIHIVSGPDIAKWYDGRFYAPGDTPLQNSCMRHDHCSSYFGIYTENPDKCRMAIMLDSDERLTGRALIWQTDDGFTFLDRIYGQDDVISAFKAYASEQGWYTRWTQTYDNKDQIVTPEGRRTSKTMQVSLDVAHGSYPYVDTFTYLCEEEGYLTNDESDENVTASLHSLYGESYPRHRRTCESCGDRINSDNSDESNYADGGWYCSDCYNEHFTTCDRCGGATDNEDVTRTPNDNYYCQSCFDRNCFHCADCGDPEFDGEGSENASGSPVCRNCADNYTYCDDCNHTIPVDEFDMNNDRCNECQLARIEAAEEAETEAANDPDPIVTEEEPDGLAVFDQWIATR